MKSNKLMVFVFGPMHGISSLNIEEFRLVENILNSKGYKAVIPHELFEAVDLSFETTDEEIMNVYKSQVRKSDCVCFLNGWKADHDSIEIMEHATVHAVKITLAMNEFGDYSKTNDLQNNINHQS